MPHLTINEATRAAAQAAYLAARHKLTSFLVQITGANLTEPCIVYPGHIIQSGAPAELEKVAAHFRKLGVSGVTIAAPEPDDMEWTFMAIPDAEIAAARAGHEAT